MSLRTFLAVDITDEATRALAAATRELKPHISKANFVAPANLHVTLHFLGSLDETALAGVCDLALEVAAAHDPLDFEMRGITVMPPGAKKPRMLWGDVADPSQVMSAVHADLAQGLADLNLRVEDRRFRPHVTLARVKSCPDAAALRQAADAFSDTLFARCPSDEITVYISDLSGGSPVYTAAARCPLGE